MDEGLAPAPSLAPPPRLRILVHDFAGHPFQIDLSRALTRRGHTVQHVYCESYTSGKGRFATGEPRLSVVPVAAGRSFDRYSPGRRARQEIAYAARFNRLAARFRPDVVLACNVPLVAEVMSARWCGRHRVPWVFWLQDLHSVAMAAEAENRAGRAGRLLGELFERTEQALLRRAGAVVSITDDFEPVLERWDIDPDACTVIENWAPLADLPLRERDNGWRQRMGLGDRFVFLYSGTLGLKHRPELLYALAEQHVDDAEVVVISEGLGEGRLREMVTARPLPNLRLVPFQPIEDYPDVLGAADVLVALLEPAAGTFSVPSKVLSYLCAGRPILGAIPVDNLAARTVVRAEAGRVVAPTDDEAFLLAAKDLRTDPEQRLSAGRCGRAYAEAVFDTATVADRFEAVIARALRRSSPTASTAPTASPEGS